MKQARSWRKSSEAAAKTSDSDAVVQADEYWQRGQILAEVAIGMDAEKSIARAKKKLEDSIDSFLARMQQISNSQWIGDTSYYKESRLESFEIWARNTIADPIPNELPAIPIGATTEDIYFKPEILRLLNRAEVRMDEATTLMDVFWAGDTIGGAWRLYKSWYLTCGKEDKDLENEVFILFEGYKAFCDAIHKLMRESALKNSEAQTQMTLNV